MTHSDRETYGHRYSDFEFCQEVMRHYNFHGGSALSPSDLEHLKKIQFEPNPVAVQATIAIAMYANQDPRLKTLLVSEVPRMRASADSNVKESAMWITKWYHVKGSTALTI